MHRFALALALALTALATGAPAHGGPGGARSRHPEPAPGGAGSRPAGSEAWAHACSFTHPVCVYAAPGTLAAVALAALEAADREWSVLTEVLGAPPPGAADDGRWRVYLVDSVDGGATAALDARDPLARFDRASSFALVDRGTPTGCDLDLALARAVARGSIWSAAPAVDDGSARAEAETLARLAAPCAAPEDDARTFQSAPERAVVDPRSPSFDRGAALLFDWLDRSFGARPGALVVGLWALAPTRTPPDAWPWARAPTGFDVLRISLRDALWKGSTLDDVFARFALVRASMLPPPRRAWRVPWPAQARRLAGPDPVAPTGAAYVDVDHAGAPAGAKLRVEAVWEDYGRMRWAVLKLDAAGRVLAEVPIESLDRGTSASMTVETLDGVDRVLVVGANVGSTEHPFDPGQGEWEPHGWLVTVAAE